MFRKSSFFATGFLAVALGATAAMAGQPGHGAESSINPQPLPPRVLQQQAGPGSRVMINPQPLPPRQQNGAYVIR